MKDNKKYKFKSTFFAILFSLLVIVRLLFEGTGGGVWNIFQIFFVLSGFAVIIDKSIEVFTSPKPIVAFTVFSIYIWLLSTLYLEQIDINKIFYFAVVPFAGMTTLVFYNTGLKTNIDRNKIIFLITFYVAAIIFFIGRRQVLTGTIDSGMMVANAYYLLTLLPLTLVFTKQKHSFLPFIVVFIVILMSGKRAGMLAISVMLFLFFLDFSFKDTKKSFQNIAILFTIILVAYFIYNLFEEQFNLDIINRLENLSEDGGSGRDTRWRKLLAGINNAHPVEFLFGHGFKSTSAYVGGEAHNDFIQVFYEYGFSGFILYIGFYFSMVRESIRMVKTKYPYAKHFLISIIAALFLAGFSFFIIEPRVIIGSAVTWGLILADWKKYQNRIKKLKRQKKYARYRYNKM